MDIINILTGVAYDIHLTKSSGEESIKCPECSESRKKKNVKCFNWNHDMQVGFCNHCNQKFGIKRERKQVDYTIPSFNNTELSDKTLAWFEGRKISKNTIKRFRITESNEFMPQESKEMKCINFNYFRDEQLVNIKFRDAKKNFKLHKGSELIFYGLDLIKDQKEIIVCEGEMDALSIYEADCFYVISVPNGANRGSRMDYFDNCYQYLTGLKKVILATDNDSVGLELRSELSRRFGRDICFIVSYPEGCKDANDVLVKFGKEKLKQIIKDAKEYPLEGITTLEDIEDEIDYIYEHGYPSSLTLGNELDNYIKWRTQEWTVVTGSPGAGKSDVVDQISLGLAIKHDWRFAVFSPENKPYQLHSWKLMQKLIGKMRHEMRPDEKDKAKDFIRDHYFWYDLDDPDMDSILEKGKELVARKGIKGMVIDPWNQIEHQAGADTETIYISKVLSKLTKFVQNYDVHVFVVAHPTKGRVTQGKLSLYDIAGSAHFFNKCFNGLVISRNMETDHTCIFVEKVKFWFVGKAGKSVEWYWDIKKGTRFFDFGNDPMPVNYDESKFEAWPFKRNEDQPF